MQNIRFVVDDDGIATATLDMPGRPFNVFSEDMMDDLEALTGQLEAGACRGLVVASGKDAFMAGADLAMVQGFTTLRFRAGADEIVRVFSRLTRLLRRFERAPVATVAAVNGLALGGGLELAMACHRRVVAQSAQPCLGLPEVLLGLLPGAGGTQRLPRLVGRALGARMLLDGAPIAPDAALAAGLADVVVPAAELLATARAEATRQRIGAHWDVPGWEAPAAGALDAADPDAEAALLRAAGVDVATAHLYPAYHAIARCVLDGYGLPIDAGFEVEIARFLTLMQDPVAGNMVRTRFLSKTAAPKRAQQALGRGAASVRTVAWGGADAPPARIARAFVAAAESAMADAVLVPAPASGMEDARAVACRDVCQADTPASGARAELRTLGPLAAAEAAEIHGATPDDGARALACANRLRLVPVVTASQPGPSARLARAARDWFDQATAAGRDLAGTSAALDLGTLRARLGLGPDSATTCSAAAKLAGIEWLFAIATEAAASLAAGEVAGAQDLDVLGVFGLGFPGWSGGPLSFLDMVTRGEIPGLVLPAPVEGGPFYGG